MRHASPLDSVSAPWKTACAETASQEEKTVQRTKQQAFDFIDRHREEMTALWAILVSHESGSADKAGVDRLAERLRDILVDSGAEARIVDFEKAGNLLVATIGADRPGRPIGLLGHYDTVFAKGTIEQRPFVIRDGKAFGPGVLDMKGGLVVLLYAIKALQAAGYCLRPLKVILAGDEEVAHSFSNATDIIRQEVAGCVAAFNFETGSINDHLVVGRKGGGTYTMEAHGVAAHTGIEPKKGRSAILELAHKIIAIHALTDWEEGTTFSVGTIQGGTTSNTTPAFASMAIDVRCLKASAEEKFLPRLRAIAEQTHIEGTRTRLSGGLGFAPMETTPDVMRLFELVATTSAENGFPTPTPVQSGGGSDSSNAVIAGVPTVCAMGVKGERNHAPEEYALVDSLFERCKLAVACILNINALHFEGTS